MSDKFFYRLMLVLAAITAIFVISTTTAYPLPGCDEATYTGAAVSLIEDGRVALRSWGIGEPMGRDTNALVIGRAYTGGLAASLMLFGRSLFAARLFSVIGWACASALLYHVARRLLEDRLLALLAALLFATSVKGLLVAHFARPEIWLCAMILASLALLLHAHESPALALVGGILSASLFDFHPNGLLFTVALAVVMVGAWLIERRGWRLIALLASGMLIGAALIVALRVLPHGVTTHHLTQLPFVANYFVDWSQALPSSTPPPPTGWLERQANFLTVIFSTGAPLSWIELVLALIGVGYAIVVPQRGARIAAIYAIALVLLPITSPLTWVQYGILWSPVFYLLGVGGVAHLARRFDADHLIRPTLTGVMLLFLAGDAWLVYKTAPNTYQAAADQIADEIPAGARVMGDIGWWWALDADYTLISDQHLAYASQAGFPPFRTFYEIEPKDTDLQIAAKLLDRIAPDYVLIDGAVGCADSASELHAAFRDQVASVCRLTAQVDTVRVGWSQTPIGAATRIYHCAD